MYRVTDLMTKRVVTIPEDMKIERICNILICNSVSGVPVVNDKNKFTGFVSERDIVAVIASGGNLDKKAKDIMCKKTTTVREDMKLTQVRNIFESKHFRHLPVIKKGEVVGVISRRDVFRKLIVP